MEKMKIPTCKNCGKSFKKTIWGKSEPYKVNKNVNLHIICGDCKTTNDFTIKNGDIAEI